MRAIIRVYASAEIGTNYQPTVTRYWNDLKAAAYGKVNFATGATDPLLPTKEIYLECLEEVSLKKLGNQDFYYSSCFTSSELDVMATTSGIYGKFGFPMGHAETRDLAQRFKKLQLQEKVVNGQRDSFVALPENEWDETSHQIGDLQICGKNWFHG